MIKTKFVQKIKPYILFSVKIYRKLSVYERKNMAEPGIPDENTIQQRKDAFRMPDNKGKAADVLMYNAICCSTLSVVRRELFIFTFYLNCLSCYTELH